MKTRLFPLFALLALSLTAGAPYTANFTTAKVDAQSMGTLAFGPDGILFVGDSIGGKIYALNLDDTTEAQIERPQSIADLEKKLGDALGVPASEVMVHDMAVNPISKNTYLSLSRGRAAWNSMFQLPNHLANANVLVKLSPAGELSLVDLSNLSHAHVDIPSPVAADKKSRRSALGARVETISDLVYHGDKLYVAGLSNEEFASTLRVFDFPFSGKPATTAVEVYHGAHGKFETHAPIRAMMPYSSGDKDYVLAAYLCTPLALFPKDELNKGEKVTGKTIGELGSRNYPTDMLHIKHEGKDAVLMSNTNRTLMIFSSEEINKLAAMDGITERVSHRAGADYKDLSGSNVQQMDMLGDTHVQMIQRMPSGKLSLYSYSLQRLLR